MPTPFVADAADEAVRSNSILNERKATDIIEETALEVDIRAWRAEGLRLLQAASARERALPRSVTGAKDPTAPTQSEGGIDRFQLSNAPEVAVTLERHSLSPYRLTLTDGL